MRLFLFLPLITFLPSLTYADNLDTQINKACLRHAVSLVARLKSEIVGELSQNQSDKALKLATESCQAYFNKEFSENPETVSSTKNSNEENDDNSVKDWLTEKVLSDDNSRKAGNKRLMKKH